MESDLLADILLQKSEQKLLITKKDIVDTNRSGNLDMDSPGKVEKKKAAD